MGDLISRSAFIEYAKEKLDICCDDLIAMIKEQPTVDAVPVVHGEWIFGKNHGEFVEAECSHCKGLLLVKWYDEIDKYRFCPNCGAKMDGKKV